MARSNHATYTAADRYERRANRRQRPTQRRLNTRDAVLRAEMSEVTR